MKYYTEDELNCTQQSPNKKDVIAITSNGQKEYISKRLMTRSIRETFRLFKAAHPDTGIGLTKFSSLRPKRVVCTAPHEVCVCTYCANAKLSARALEIATGQKKSVEDLRDLTVCKPPSRRCFLSLCDSCPTPQVITAPNLGIPEEEEVVFTTWQKGDLVKKEVSPDDFVQHLQQCLKNGCRTSTFGAFRAEPLANQNNPSRKAASSCILTSQKTGP